jgi:2-succinyl-5-enolpyruvyl-6-hydroxy-3-cyclohexene-1-carboxylate synthase
MSKGGDLPALICTSGTAVANYLPGIVEAYYSRTPLLIITCDRPWELQSAGANQTIKQNDIFKDFISLKIEIGPFDKVLGLHSLFANLASLVYTAKTTSRPVHCNICFRKPFYDAGFNPESDLLDEDSSVYLRWYNSQLPYVDMALDNRDLSRVDVSTKNSAKKERTLFVLGPTRDKSLIGMIGRIAKERNIPILADIHSNIRQENYPTVSGYYNLYLKDMEDSSIPSSVFLFGDRIISDELQKFLARVNGQIVQVGADSLRQDAIENEFIRVTKKVDLDYFINTELDLLLVNEATFTDKYLSLESKYDTLLRDLFKKEDGSERSLIFNILEAAPENSKIFLAISLIFREADNFCRTLPVNSMLYANRGATGIDGIISSSVGVGFNSIDPLICIIGDQASLHDLTGLSLVNRRQGPTLVLIINNNGGAIFNIMKKPEILDTLIHSHGYNFEHFAKGFSLEYKKTRSVQEAVSIMKDLFSSSNSKLLLEVEVNGVESAKGLRL